MPIYRALRKLSGVAERSTLTRLEHLSAEEIATLEQVGAIARISTPPLSIFPDWRGRATRLAKAGIETAEQFLDADDDLLCRVLRVKPETIQRYRSDLESQLIVKDAPGVFPSGI